MKRSTKTTTGSVIAIVIAVIAALSQSSHQTNLLPSSQATVPERSSAVVTDSSEQLEPEALAEYIRQEHHLPPYFVTKKEAAAAGWVPSKGNLWDVLPGKVIGGDVFTNRQRVLPSQKGRRWYEADIHYHGGSRNAERILFSNDSLVYYTKDHYVTFVEIKP